MLIIIKKCITLEEITSTFPIMKHLRPTIKLENYAKLVTSLMTTENYQLIGAYSQAGICVGAVGIRFRCSLFREGKRELYVDDLVSDPEHRSLGIGHQMMAWLKAESKKENCVGIVLDSGLTRTDAHRFYKREGMEATALHFFRPNSPDGEKENLITASIQQIKSSL